MSEDCTTYNEHQHCQFPAHDGWFSHTAEWCGERQPRLCACAYCYAPGYADRWNNFIRIISAYRDLDAREVVR